MKRARAVPMPDNPNRGLGKKGGRFRVVIENRISAFKEDWFEHETVKEDMPYEEADQLARQLDEGLTPKPQ